MKLLFMFLLFNPSVAFFKTFTFFKNFKKLDYLNKSRYFALCNNSINVTLPTNHTILNNNSEYYLTLKYSDENLFWDDGEIPWDVDYLLPSNKYEN